MSTITKVQDVEERLSIDDWIRDPAKARTVEFESASNGTDSRNPQKLPYRCIARQMRPVHISAYGFGHTCGEAFWNAVGLFKTHIRGEL